MASRRILMITGSAVLAFQLVATVVAVAANWPAQFGGVGTDAAAEALTRGTALSAPLAPLLVLALGIWLARRGRVRASAGVLLVVAAAMLLGALGEALAPATPDVPKAVLVVSGAIGAAFAALVVAAVGTALRAPLRAQTA